MCAHTSRRDERWLYSQATIFFILQIVGRGSDQVAITTKFETRDDTCRLFKCFLFKFTWVLQETKWQNVFAYMYVMRGDAYGGCLISAVRLVTGGVVLTYHICLWEVYCLHL